MDRYTSKNGENIPKDFREEEKRNSLLEKKMSNKEMSSFKFCQVTVASKDFYKVIPIDIDTLNVDNIMV